MNRISSVNVIFQGRKVGKLARTANWVTAFQYDKQWLIDGFSISPLSLPLKDKVFIAKIDPFEGVHGIFADSLPDGWGRLLLDRLLLKEKINPAELDPIERLSIVGQTGMGALEYQPENKLVEGSADLDLDIIATKCKGILETNYSENLDKLFELGGSSGGARPKILTEYNGEQWIIKFPSSVDDINIGEQEWKYSNCARECGIEMTETKLFPSALCKGYFGTKRFDREFDENGVEKKIHMASAAALLETTHRIPNLDYNILMELTLKITRDFEQVEKLFRLMCFNVYAHNRDDHAKNFTYIFDQTQNQWKLSPAYDLTYSNSIGGEHATCVNGNGTDPGLEDILEVAKNIGINISKAKQVANEIKDIITENNNGVD
ncbi:MAG: type II toxin-antitoxin system HipA family toxin [Anaerovoracaceae bacterium]